MNNSGKKKIITIVMLIITMISIPFIARSNVETIDSLIEHYEDILQIKQVSKPPNAREELTLSNGWLVSIRQVFIRRLSPKYISQIGYIGRNLSLFILTAFVAMLGIALQIYRNQKFIIEYIHNKDGP
ncbi:MAG: hypothetical protein J6W35_06485 [Eubacterium sp.]|nr:hypothetical protein [Eubacterium sp.]